MTCEHEGKYFYERKKNLFRAWYYKNRTNPAFCEEWRLRSKESYRKSRENLKNLRDINSQLQIENDNLKKIIQEMKELIEMEIEEEE